MIILNYRKGFAANSSSTHSTFFVEDITKVKERVFDEYCFGWEPFILTSKQMIKNYVKAQTLYNLGYYLTQDSPQLYSKVWIERLKKKVHDYLTSIFGDNSHANLQWYEYIDHQSRWLLPPYFNTKYFPSKQLVIDILDYLLKNNTVVCGGNDNERDDIDDYIKTTITNNKILPIRDMGYYSDSFCIKNGDIWIICNKSTGNRIMFSFTEPELTKTEIPVLVDLIVTNNCKENCPFCYRDCNESGQIASLSVVKNYIKTLEKLQVPEIAIGGGDILSLPYLKELCHFIKGRNTIINTTIKVTQSMMNRGSKEFKRVKMVLSSFNGVAFSVSNEIESKFVVSLQTKYPNKISIQLIPEIQSNAILFKIIDTLNYSTTLTLLGYKDTGRAVFNDLKRNTEVMSFIEHLKFKCNINVDTKFLCNFPQITELLEKWTYMKEEGKVSCCIDAIHNKMADSSYSSRWYEINSASEILKIFSKF